MDLYAIARMIDSAINRSKGADVCLLGRKVRKLYCARGLCVAHFDDPGALPVIEECTITPTDCHIVYREADGAPCKIRCYELQ